MKDSQYKLYLTEVKVHIIQSEKHIKSLNSLFSALPASLCKWFFPVLTLLLSIHLTDILKPLFKRKESFSFLALGPPCAFGGGFLMAIRTSHLAGLYEKMLNGTLTVLKNLA